MNKSYRTSVVAVVLGCALGNLSAIPFALAVDAPGATLAESTLATVSDAAVAGAANAGVATSADAAGGAQTLTPAQVNEMLQTLRMQVAQQNALLQMLAQDKGAAGSAAAPASADSNAQAPGTAGKPAGDNGSPAAVTVVGVPGAQAAAPATVVPLPEPVAIVPPVSVAPVMPAGAAVAQAVPDAAAETVKKAYASGVSVWREIQRSVETQRNLGIRLDTNEVLAGIQDSAQGRSLRYSEQDLTAALSSLNQDYMARAAGERDTQRIDGKVFRQTFSKQKDVKSDAGSLYQILARGTGRNLRTTDTVSLSVTGTLPDGTVFDGSGQNGQSKTAKVGALMPAVAIGLQKIARGGHIKVVVPPEKGYGDAGLPPVIPGGATLIFDITVADEG